MTKSLSAFLLLATAGVALAAQAQDQAKAPAKLKLTAPEGPVTITADRAEFERNGVMLYRGNVRLVSDRLTLTGERVELRQPSPGQFEARITGTPARLSHAGEADSPPIAAAAGRIDYDTRQEVVSLSGGAQLERGTDVLTGESIRYEIATRRISATGVDGGQVRIVIQQPEAKAREAKP